MFFWMCCISMPVHAALIPSDEEWILYVGKASGDNYLFEGLLRMTEETEALALGVAEDVEKLKFYFEDWNRQIFATIVDDADYIHFLGEVFLLRTGHCILHLPRTILPISQERNLRLQEWDKLIERCRKENNRYSRFEIVYGQQGVIDHVREAYVLARPGTSVRAVTICNIL